MFSAFQPSAYQRNAYQINSGVAVDNTQGGGKKNNTNYSNSRWDSRHEWENDQLKRVKAEKEQAERDLQAKEVEIAALEKKRAKLLADQRMQAELMLMFIEAKRLEDERLRLELAIKRFMQDEEEVYILLMCLPFIA